MYTDIYCYRLYLENTGIVFKARWFIWREMTRAMPSSFHLNNGRARVYIRPYKS